MTTKGRANSQDSPHAFEPSPAYPRILASFFRPPLLTTLLIFHVGWLFVAVVAVRNNQGVWIFLGPIIWAGGMVLLLIWHTGFCVMHRGGEKPGGLGRALWLTPATLIAVALSSLIIHDNLPRTRFARYVIDPIPSSVRIIKSGGEDHLLFGASVFYFEIAPTDLPVILSRHNYSPATSVSTVEQYLSDYLDMSLQDLEPYDLLHVNLAEPDFIGTHDEYVVVPEDRRSAVLINAGGG